MERGVEGGVAGTAAQREEGWSGKGPAQTIGHGRIREEDRQKRANYIKKCNFIEYVKEN